MNTLRIRNRLLALDRPRVMGIINVTPDSFYAGSRQETVAAAVAQAQRMAEEGADLLDLGGMSTRPGAADVPEAEELARLLPVVEAVRAALPAVAISVDTFRPGVAARCLEAGADIVNDISGGADPAMYAVAAEAGAPYVLMHMRGTPQTMSRLTDYEDVVSAVMDYFLERVDAARAAGVGDILLDPGLGFAKTTAQNFELLRRLPELSALRLPVLVGLSRKGMVWKTLGVAPDAALNGSTALHMAALLGGAGILRVHDVREAVETVRLFEALLDTCV